MICTIGSGGTGISLDDTLGNAPRTIIIMTAPMNSIKTVQVMGRVVRANTKSLSRAFFLFAAIYIEEWLKNLLATKLKMLGAMVAGQVELLSPKEVEAIEAGGDAGAVGAFYAGKEKDQKLHSLFTTKPGMWIDGREYPQQKPLFVQKVVDGFARRQTFINIKGVSRLDIMRLAQEQAVAFEKFGFTKKSERYEGTFYQAPYTDEAWTWALNLIKLERAGVVGTAEQLFAVGSVVEALSDITISNTKAGTRGTVTEVRPRRGLWRYDVRFEDGTNAESIEQEILGSTAPIHSFRVGQVYSIVRTMYNTVRRSYVPSRTRLTIKSITGPTSDPRFEVEVRFEIQTDASEWIDDPEMTQLVQRNSDVLLAKLEEVIQARSLTCEMNCAPEPEAVGVADRFEYPPRDSPLALNDPEAIDETTTEERADSGTEENYQIPYTPQYADDSPPAPRSSAPVVRNVRELAKLNIKRRQLSPRFQSLFGSVPMRCRYFIEGPAGHGKSSLAMQFCDEIARQELRAGKRVLYVNGEQPSDGGGMTDRLRNNRVTSEGIDVVDTRDQDVVHELLQSGTYSFVVIDSISRMRGTDREKVAWLLRLYDEFPTISFVLIAHDDKAEKTYKGPSDYAHDAEVWVRVEQGKARTMKNHFGPHNTIDVIPYGATKSQARVRQ